MSETHSCADHALSAVESGPSRIMQANDSLWIAAKNQGFEVVVHERSRFSGREKKIDTSVVTDLITDSYEAMKPGSDDITLVAGDADYVPTVQKLRARGFNFEVCFWNHAANPDYA